MKEFLSSDHTISAIIKIAAEIINHVGIFYSPIYINPAHHRMILDIAIVGLIITIIAVNTRKKYKQFGFKPYDTKLQIGKYRAANKNDITVKRAGSGIGHTDKVRYRLAGIGLPSSELEPGKWPSIVGKSVMEID